MKKIEILIICNVHQLYHSKYIMGDNNNVIISRMMIIDHNYAMLHENYQNCVNEINKLKNKIYLMKDFNSKSFEYHGALTNIVSPSHLPFIRLSPDKGR